MQCKPYIVRISIWFVVLVLLLFGFAFASSIKSKWQLGLIAHTNYLKIELVRPTQWLVGSASICYRKKSGEISSEGNLDNKDGPSICGGSGWQLKQLPEGIIDDWLLDLRASDNEKIYIIIESDVLGWVRMSLRTNQSSLGYVGSAEKSLEKLPSQMNVVWPNKIDDETMVFPFIGPTQIGQEVTTSTQALLESGNITIFAASQDSLAGRVVAEEYPLILGDQLDLGIVSTGKELSVIPKGFLRFGMYQGEPVSNGRIEVVQLADAKGATVSRYGAGSYEFSPSLWMQLKHHSGLIIGLVVITGLLNLGASLSNILQFVSDWRKRIKKKG